MRIYNSLCLRQVFIIVLCALTDTHHVPWDFIIIGTYVVWEDREKTCFK